MKKILSSIIFIIIFICLYDFIAQKIVSKAGGTNFNQFYHQKQNVDILFIGPSAIHNLFSPMYIWNKYGIISYNRGTQAQSYILSYVLMEESIKKLKPKVIVMDISVLALGKDINPNINNAIMNNIDSIYYRIKVCKLMKCNINDLNIYMLYHTRIKNLNKNDFTEDEYFKGQNNVISLFSKKQNYMPNKNKIELSDSTKEYTDKIDELGKKYNIEIFFICNPTASERNIYYKEFEKYAYEKKLNYINYNNLLNELDIDYAKDFHDKYHLNYPSGIKVLDHLMVNILKKIKIENKKNKIEYRELDIDYEKYSAFINKELIRQIYTLHEWKKYVKNNNYIIITSTKYGVIRHIPKEVVEFFYDYKLEKYLTNKVNQKYIAIFNDKNIFYENISDTSIKYSGRLDNKVNLYVESSEGKTSIKISGKEISLNKYGVNIVVYDIGNKEIIDRLWLDPSRPNIINR